ncbi:hypothetical protein C8Q69DRAFT_528695 [Paecilomyces variotii]|uniref:Uncharacterized protein n=1 Tax=Byssochlamys spectabilis TaxID=264951 RepID=A0A443HS11_BYSSP|nr:hypothetical protein C8Q69DRAFT_528695 [Paecilomyces variotii]RWQ94612.1 hypothetical protein C8Q69DRAFT_528695 [Paecilomyces variotii]
MRKWHLVYLHLVCRPKESSFLFLLQNSLLLLPILHLPPVYSLSVVSCPVLSDNMRRFATTASATFHLTAILIHSYFFAAFLVLMMVDYNTECPALIYSSPAILDRKPGGVSRFPFVLSSIFEPYGVSESLRMVFDGQWTVTNPLARLPAPKLDITIGASIWQTAYIDTALSLEALLCPVVCCPELMVPTFTVEAKCFQHPEYAARQNRLNGAIMLRNIQEKNEEVMVSTFCLAFLGDMPQQQVYQTLVAVRGLAARTYELFPNRSPGTTYS